MGIGKTSFYQTMKNLGIVPSKSETDNKTALITIAEYQRLLDHYQAKTVEQNGMTTKLTLAAVEERTKPRTDRQTDLVMPALEIISRLVPAAPPADPLVTHRTLQEACDRNWRLSTHQLAQLLGRSPKSIQGFQAFDQLGFKFVSHGKGKYRAWEVQKN